jgi:hypothetical protein
MSSKSVHLLQASRRSATAAVAAAGVHWVVHHLSMLLADTGLTLQEGDDPVYMFNILRTKRLLHNYVQQLSLGLN